MNLVDRLVRNGNGTLNPIRKTTMNPNAARITFMSDRAVTLISI